MIRGQEEEQKLKINRGMEFMLHNKKIRRKELFRIIIDKGISFLSREISLKFEFTITKKHSGKNNV
jgi:hypothetical protein